MIQYTISIMPNYKMEQRGGILKLKMFPGMSVYLQRNSCELLGKSDLEIGKGNLYYIEGGIN